jgi:hypothetical protein
MHQAKEWAKKYDITIVIPRSPNAPQDDGNVRLMQWKDRNPAGTVGLVCIDYMSMLKEDKDGTVQPNPLDGDKEQ